LHIQRQHITSADNRRSLLRTYLYMSVTAIITIMLYSCRDGDTIIYSEENAVEGMTAEPNASITGMYVLNEGNMGSNKCTLDYLDYTEGTYSRNIYSERNPNAVKELGDVGNDIKTYQGRMYMVINCSNKVEVVNASNAIRIGQIDVPNCRYITFDGNYAYVSSYVGTVGDPQAPLGEIYKIDISTLKTIARCTVGYQPEEMVVDNGKLYVANSGGYRVGVYDYTVSEIDLSTFKELRKIPVAINLHHLKMDSYGQMWVSSRGNYSKENSRLFVMSKKNGEMTVCDSIDIPCSSFALRGDSMYIISANFDNYNQSNTVGYGIINVKTHEIISRNFIADGTDSEIKVPYCIALHPTNGDIYVMDAKNYVSSGTLSCYGTNGKRKWQTRTGDIPGSSCFISR
jgi:DNA-binding beta-propeller fold protein YncE